MILALDIGGTKLAAALFEEDKILERSLHPIRGSGAEVGRLICGVVQDMVSLAKARRKPVHALGVCIPGISYPQDGTVWAPNIRGWEKYPLRKELASLFSGRAQIKIGNDRACYILGESRCGAAQGCRDAVFLAVGTGIGAGILANGEVLHGVGDSAGAIGWMALRSPWLDHYAGCGCFEHHASGPGLVKAAKSILNQPAYRNSTLHQAAELTTRRIFAAASRKDAAAQAILSSALQFWGMAAANLVSLFNPEKIIFGGGVFGPARRLIPQIQAEAARWAQPVAIRQVIFEASRLGADAGLYGAACLVRPER
jgi:glucokinase